MFVAVDESDHESDDAADGEMQLMPADSESVLEAVQHDGKSDATSAVVRVPANETS